MIGWGGGGQKARRGQREGRGWTGTLAASGGAVANKQLQEAEHPATIKDISGVNKHT